MQILSDYFYRASALQKIVNLILEKLNTFHCTCRLMDVDIIIFSFFILPCNIELCSCQLVEAVLLKA